MNEHRRSVRVDYINVRFVTSFIFIPDVFAAGVQGGVRHVSNNES